VSQLISVEISLYPLTAEYIPVILDFIQRLRANRKLTIVTNTMSTQVQGEYDEVWDTLKREMRPNLTGSHHAVFATKFLGPVEAGLVYSD
jgi:uncharacterized protein YqgV (UPF0045/DUF77 family)